MSLYNLPNLIHVLRDHQNKSAYPVFILRQLLPRGSARMFTEAEHHFTRLNTPHACLPACLLPCTAAYSILLHILQSTNLDHITHSTLTFCSGTQPSLSSKMISYALRDRFLFQQEHHVSSPHLLDPASRVPSANQGFPFCSEVLEV
jgi:hypothetical protein